MRRFFFVLFPALAALACTSEADPQLVSICSDTSDPSWYYISPPKDPAALLLLGAVPNLPDNHPAETATDLWLAEDSGRLMFCRVFENPGTSIQVQTWEYSVENREIIVTKGGMWRVN